MGRDARQLSRETQAELRRLAVRMCVELEESPEAVARFLEVTPLSVRQWVSRYRREGQAVFSVSQGRGRPERKLAPDQEAWLQQTLASSTPEDFGLRAGGWTSPKVRALIEQTYGVELGERTVRVYLRRWGWVPRVATKRAVKRDESAIARFREEDAPALLRLAETQGARVLFLDECQVREDATRPVVWSPRGCRPVLASPGTRQRVNLISTVSVDGRLWFRAYRGSLTAARLLKLLHELAEDFGGQPLYIVLDGLAVHFAKELREALVRELPNLHLVRLPAYAPELNPDEYIWAFLKNRLYRSEPLLPKEEIEDAALWELEQLQQDPVFVQSLLRHPDLAYLHDEICFPEDAIQQAA